MGNIITVADLALEGITGEPGRLETLIGVVENRIEDFTGYRFYSHSATFTLDGQGSESLILPQPIISITSITEDEANVDLDDLTIYSRRPPGFDDRFYPRVAKITSLATLFERGGKAEALVYWNPGVGNVVVVGTFGFTELVGAVEAPPREIKDAAIRWVARLVPRAGVDDEHAQARVNVFGTDIGAGDVKVALDAKAVGTGPSFDPHVDAVLQAMRHPAKARALFSFGGA